MITDLKVYIIIALALWQGVAQWQLHSVKTDYQEYKENIHAQIQTAKIDKARIEAEQRAKLDKATLDYSDARQRLGIVLKRLRDAEIMSGNCSLPVAGNGASSMPRTSENPSGVINPVETSAGTGSFTYENAMNDTLQCSKLIKFVRD